MRKIDWLNDFYKFCYDVKQAGAEDAYFKFSDGEYEAVGRIEQVRDHYFIFLFDDKDRFYEKSCRASWWYADVFGDHGKCEISVEDCEENNGIDFSWL